jgi:hypothetical protein
MKHYDPRIVTIVTASLFATAAHAQSSVTLYGMIDNGISYVNNAVNAKGGHSSLIKEDEGVDGGSRWGITGVEDLGGGLRTVFVLENGFQAFARRRRIWPSGLCRPRERWHWRADLRSAIFVFRRVPRTQLRDRRPDQRGQLCVSHRYDRSTDGEPDKQFRQVRECGLQWS